VKQARERLGLLSPAREEKDLGARRFSWVDNAYSTPPSRVGTPEWRAAPGGSSGLQNRGKVTTVGFFRVFKICKPLYQKNGKAGVCRTRLGPLGLEGRLCLMGKKTSNKRGHASRGRAVGTRSATGGRS